MRNLALAVICAVPLVSVLQAGLVQGIQTKVVSTEPTRELRPGAGFGADATIPTSVGTQGDFGFDAKVIARWDVVPFQTFSKSMNVGVVAFHLNGIERVDFSVNGGPWLSIHEATLNPTTSVVEYWATINAADFPDGAIEVRAIAWPKVAGIPRQLAGDFAAQKVGDHSLPLFANANNSLTLEPIYVSSAGNDDSPGTVAQPVKSIAVAIRLAKNGSKIIIQSPGTYDLPPGTRLPAALKSNPNWITIEGDSLLDKRSIIVRQKERSNLSPGVSRLHWHNVSFDFSGIFQYQPAKNGAVWFSNVLFFNSEGWARNYEKNPVPFSSSQAKTFFTDCIAEDSRYGFVSGWFVRGCHLRKISGDALQNSKFIVNCTVENMRQAIPSLHKDVLQMWGGHENTIAYGVRATDLQTTQGIFLQTGSGWKKGDIPRFLDCAFVDIEIVPNNPKDKIFSQCEGLFRNVLFKNVNTHSQKMFLRRDMNDPKRFKFPFESENVVFENCMFGNTISNATGLIVRTTDD